MQQKISSSKPRRFGKFSFALATIALLIGGFFIYKYSYIYLERKKYDQAATVLHKVADDLRTQGIKTEFSRGCGRAEQVFGDGAVSCSVGIEHKGIESKENSNEYTSMTSATLVSNGFAPLSDGAKTFVFSPQVSGNQFFRLTNSSLNCQLSLYSLRPNADTYQLIVSCSKQSKYFLF